jgi:5-methylcytosine-specific restriction enzyme subunit McrC
MPQIISEYGVIRKASDFDLSEDSFSEIFVSDKTFFNLKLLAFSGDNDLIMSCLTQKGKEQIKVKNYVGLIQTADGLQIEILPKSSGNSAKEARKILLKMLRVLPKSPYQSLSNAHLESCHLPIFEIFVNVFLDELEKLLSQGLGRNYESKAANEVFVKGKILVAENIHQNFIKKTHFFVVYDDFVEDIPQNRILKTCLQLLYNQSGGIPSFTNGRRSAKTQQRILQNLTIFDEVSILTNIHQDLETGNVKNRIFERYDAVLNWAKIFLNQQSFSPFSGKMLQLALLFPMEVLFENYVGKAFKKQFSENYEVKLQDKGKHLIDRHLETPKFRLIPDIVLENEAEIFIFDTKWKLLDASKSNQNYGIEQADLYQMYAYGKKYGSKQLFLIYPANENFKIPLTFDYDEGMTLHVFAFDLSGEASNEIMEIKQNLRGLKPVVEQLTGFNS